MNGRTLTLATVATLFATFGCGPSGSGSGYKPKKPDKPQPVAVTAGQEAELFPAKVGSSWTYDATASQASPGGSRSSASLVTFRVKSVTDVPAGRRVLIEITSDEKLTDRLRWVVGKKGIYQETKALLNKGSLTDVTYSPPLPICTFPISSGKGVQGTHSGARATGNSGPFKSVLTTLGNQTVDTETGRMSTIATEQVSTYTDKNNVKVRSVSTAFWAPKVGLVRYVQEVVEVNAQGQQRITSSTLRLKSHS